MREYKYLDRPIPKHIVEQIRANTIKQIAELDFCSICEEKGRADDCYYCRVARFQEHLSDLKEHKNDN